MQGQPTITLRLDTPEEIESYLRPLEEAEPAITLDAITFITYPDVLLTMTDRTQYEGSMNDYTREKFDLIVDFPDCVIDFPYCKLSGFDDDNDYIECAVYLEDY